MKMYYVKEYTPGCRFFKIINSTLTGFVDQVYIVTYIKKSSFILADGIRLEETVSGSNEDNQVSNMFLCSFCFYFDWFLEGYIFIIDSY
jgi:hypothetical protein